MVSTERIPGLLIARSVIAAMALICRILSLFTHFYLLTNRLLILLLPLLLFPRFLLFLSQSPSQPHISLSESFAASSSKLPSSRSSAREGHYDDLTGLEHFLCTQMGIGLLAVMGMCLLLIPTPPRPTSFPPLDPTTNVPIPFTTSQPLNLRMPFLLILSSLMGLSAFMSWNSSGTAEAIGGGLGGVVALGNGAVAIWGWWVAVFGTSQKYLSKKTVSLMLH